MQSGQGALGPPGRQRGPDAGMAGPHPLHDRSSAGPPRPPSCPTEWGEQQGHHSWGSRNTWPLLTSPPCPAQDLRRFPPDTLSPHAVAFRTGRPGSPGTGPTGGVLASPSVPLGALSRKHSYLSLANCCGNWKRKPRGPVRAAVPRRPQGLSTEVPAGECS